MSAVRTSVRSVMEPPRRSGRPACFCLRSRRRRRCRRSRNHSSQQARRSFRDVPFSRAFVCRGGAFRSGSRSDFGPNSLKMASALTVPADWLTACNGRGTVQQIQVAADSALMAVTDHSSPVAQEPSGFEVAVRARSWDWLLELRRRLKVDIQLVDDRHSPLLPFAAAGPAPSLAGLWEHREPVIVSAVTSALQTRVPPAVAWHGLQITCLALTVERGTSGVLVLGRMLPPGQDSE